MIQYTVQKTLAEMSERKRLCLISWAGREPKLDIRDWYTKDGQESPGKGVTLTDEEGRELLAGLQEYFRGE